MLLVVLEHDRGTLGEPAREALTFGRTLAAKMGVEMHALAIGAGAAATEQVAAVSGDHGATRLYTVDHDVLSDFGPEAWGQSLVQVIGELAPGAVLACGSERGNEVMAQAAARLDWPFVANCTDITPPAGGEGQWSMTRIQWGGSLLEDATLAAAGVALLTCGLHTVLLFTGDTLFPGGPGATQYEGGDFETIIRSIEDRIFSRFDGSTVVLPGHGLDTTIGTETPHLDEWIARGW